MPDEPKDRLIEKIFQQIQADLQATKQREQLMASGNVEEMLFSPKTPMDQKVQLLATLATSQGKAAQRTLAKILKYASNGQVTEEGTEVLLKMIKALESGALRKATFIRVEEAAGGLPRGHVVTSEGTWVCALFPKKELLDQMECGDPCLLDADTKAVLFRCEHSDMVGIEVEFGRDLEDGRIEIRTRDEDAAICYSSASLLEAIEAGEVTPGQKLLAHPKQLLAYAAVPLEDSLSHYRYLDKAGIPNVSVKKDIANAPSYIEQMLEHIRDEMTDPESRRQFKLGPTATTILMGPTGTGKSFSIDGFIRATYELMSELTGIPLDELPPRVMRMRMSQLLSKWLGESDKRIDRFFDEVLQLAAEPFVTEDGREFRLPVIAIGEECDAIGRERGTDHEAVMDRILGTVLRRLDPNRPEFENAFSVWIFTTNVAHLLDPAWARRCGHVEYFRRLTAPESFGAVLFKQLHGLPCRYKGERDRDRAREAIVSALQGHFFRDADPLVELKMVGTSEPQLLHYPNFMTPGLINQAVTRSAKIAHEAWKKGKEHDGITAHAVKEALTSEIDGILHRLTRENVGSYVDLPDGVRITDLVRHYAHT